MNGATSRAEPTRAPGIATLYVIAAALGFSTITILTVLATREGTPLLTVLVGRYVSTTLVLLPVVGGAAAFRIGRGRVTRLVAIGGSLQAAIALLSLSALAFIPAATMVFLFYTYPAWVAVLAVARGSERIGRARATAMLISFTGIAVMVGMPGADEINPLGAALALTSALVYAIYIPILDALQRGSKPEVATFHVSLGALALLMVVGVVRAELTVDVPPVSWVAMLALGVVSTAASFALFLRGLHALGPVRTSIVSTAEPFFAAILAALVLDQPITLPTALGGALIATAVVMLQRNGER